MKPTQDEMNKVMRLFEEEKLLLDPHFMNPSILPYALGAVIVHLRHDWESEQETSGTQFTVRRTITGLDTGAQVLTFAVVVMGDSGAVRVTTPEISDRILEETKDSIVDIGGTVEALE